MNRQFLSKIGIGLVVVASIGLVGCSGNKDKDLVQDENQTAIEEDFEDTYIDDGYDDVEDEDLNDEFKEKVESSNSNNKKDESTSSNKKDDSANKTENNKDENKEDEKNKEDEEDNKDTESSKPDNSTSNKKDAVFQGFADSNFIEVKIGNQYSTYKVSPEAKKVLDGKNIGDSISFEYKEENGQSVIIAVK